MQGSTISIDAKIVALGSANKNTGQPQVYISYDFGVTWKDEVLINANGGIFSLTFASATRFFVGTVKGEVFRADFSAGQWKVNRIDNAPAAQLALNGIVSDIAIDWSDQTGASIYICFGGFGDARHIWHFDGTKWQARSGTLQSKRLLDVEHNAIVVDRASPSNVYAGADIGVWHSADSGATWEPLPNNLPDAPVFDLQIHPTQRLLRASTHGRGLFEWKI